MKIRKLKRLRANKSGLGDIKSWRIFGCNPVSNSFEGFHRRYRLHYTRARMASGNLWDKRKGQT